MATAKRSTGGRAGRSQIEESAALALSSLRRVVRVLRISDKQAERSLGISVAQLYVLRLLERDHPLSVGELARRTLTDVSSVSVVVRRLTERRLVRREVAEEDARRAEIHLTPEGRALLRKAPISPQEKLLDALRALPEARRTVLAASLDQVARAMGEDVTPTFFFEDDDEPPKAKPRTTAARRRVARRGG